MKVTVTKNLNVRVGKPSVNAPCYRYLVPGSVVKVDGILYEGDEYNGVNTWMKDKAGNYYWSGGLTSEVLEESREKEQSESGLLYDPIKMSWGHKYYDLPFIWKDLQTIGKNTVVAVIDTGADLSHSDLATNIHPASRNVLGSPMDFEDTNGHGTRMAGIIAATGAGKVYGVAPAAQLVIIKATETKYGADPKNFAKALKYAATLPEVDIISVSYTLNDDPDLHQSVQSCLDNGKIVVASIGNMRNEDLSEDEDTFPSGINNGKDNTGIKEVLAVGAFNEQGKLCSFSNWNHHLSLIAPGFKIITANIGDSTILESGTSIATAFVSGCLALMVSHIKLTAKSNPHLVEYLLKTCDDYGPEIGFDIKSGFGKMNLRNAVAKIKE